MTYPSVRSSSSGEGSGSAPNIVPVTLPGTISAGDTLIVILAQDSSTGLTTDGTFTSLGSFVHSTAQHSFAVFYKKAVGTEDGTTINFTGNTLQYAWVAYCFQDAADPSVTPPTISASNEGTDTSCELLICNPGSSKEYYWIACGGCDRRAFTAYPTDFSLNRLTAGTSSTLNSSAAGAGRQATASSYTPTGTFTIGSSDEWMTYHVAIHPVPAATTVEGWGWMD